MQGKKGTVRRVAALTTAVTCVCALYAGSASAAAPLIVKAQVIEVTATSATLAASINPEGKETSYQFRFGTSDCSIANCSRIPVPKEAIGSGSTPVLVEKVVEKLKPGTIYHFLLEAENPDGKVKSGDHAFTALSEPSEGLPDGRVYEQASPMNKNGGDALGEVGLVKAADDGNGITFNSTFGIPGGKGAQRLPTYLARRGAGQAGWSTQGLLPPPSFADIAQIQGWLPDFSETFANATILGETRVKALISQSTTGAPVKPITPYTSEAEYSYVGTDADNSTVFFESQAKLPPEEGKEPIPAALEGKSNLYAWDRASGRISLVDVSNLGKAPAGGGFAGPYDWSNGMTAYSLTHGGAQRNYYLQETNAITAAGDIYFTEAGTAQLYLRRNPTQPQSAMEGEKCLEKDKACTVRVSASKRAIPDPAGAQPAAFQAATEDGSEVFFTSPQKLTDDANTGPEQPEATITQASSATGQVEKAKFIPEHAVGVVVDGAHVYWADPASGAIGRADLDGNPESIEKAFIAVPPSECEETEPGVFEKVDSHPRYLAVTAKYIYWTNSGKFDEEGNPEDETGTIGRAELDGDEVKDIDPDFICGASNPQGIAANATHLYWANSAKEAVEGGVARANIEDDEVKEVKQQFYFPGSSQTPFGVALDGTYVYFTLDNTGVNFSNIGRIPLEGGAEEAIFIGESGLRSLAADGTYLYWTAQREHKVGRIALADFSTGNSCGVIPTCSKEFAKDIEGDLNGIAVNSEHLYWSVNGEAPTNPGNDLYSFHPQTGQLEDLTVDPVEDGAEVQGVLGSSADGSYLYFVANGDLDEGGPATRGDCRTAGGAHGPIATTSGSCNLYLRHEGKAHLIARVSGHDALDWTGSALGIFSIAGSVPKASFLSQGGQTLLFQSRAKLTGYENEGVSELYRYSAQSKTLDCVSCQPTGEAVKNGPSLASFSFPGSIGPPAASVNSVASRNLSADGKHVFFDTAEALVPGDTNGKDEEGKAHCPGTGPLGTPVCSDVYEWEAPSPTGACKEGAPAYSPINGGCIYLISTGKDKYPSLFADASESGDDVFFFTRQRLVGQDQDELQDVYDARVGGGLDAQNQVKPPPCQSTEACHQPSPPAPVESTPATPGFFGPSNPKPVHKKPKAQKHKHKKHKKHKAKKKHKRAGAKGRTQR